MHDDRDEDTRCESLGSYPNTMRHQTKATEWHLGHLEVSWHHAVYHLLIRDLLAPMMQ